MRRGRTQALVGVGPENGSGTWRALERTLGDNDVRINGLSP
jgi:hypothetical protein